MPAKIKDLFDPAQDIYRAIEKVITYNANQTERLKAEISEYVVTERMEDQFASLMDSMQRAMDEGGANEVGVWVSGFYGSGKSSFTKYLGYALDDSVIVDGRPFLNLLQDRFSKQQTRQQLATLARKYPVAVVMLDLASEMLAGATMEEVSTVLYYKVLQWAGYSKNLKVAALERKLQKDGKFDEFVARVKADYGIDWVGAGQNDVLVTDTIVPSLAHAFYPDLFKTETAFSTSTSEIISFENDRVKEMLDIVREKSGKKGVLFIIDEVGQYVASRGNLILNLDGLAKNIKSLGNGKAWIFGTAQQTLTEDDSRAALNSAELFKLKDRFPLSVHLESSDIREICHRRLLGKSADGTAALDALFEKHGPELCLNTKLKDARRFDSDFGKEEFAKFYPFLPAHFDILLHLLGALAKSTGGIGLRSAIKVVQDILVGEGGGAGALAECEVGRLVSTTTLYDALAKDFQRAFPALHKAVARVEFLHPDEPDFTDAAKTIAILQALDGIVPATAENTAALMQGSVDAPSRLDAVRTAVSNMISDPSISLGEKDGRLRFFSEKLADVEQERARLSPRTSDERRIRNEVLREIFTPLPSATIHGTFLVRAGLQVLDGASEVSIAGEQDPVQIVVELADAGTYDIARDDLVRDSRQPNRARTIFLAGRRTPEMDAAVQEIYRAEEIANHHRADADAEIKDYCAAQADRSKSQREELRRLLQAALYDGSFVFRGSEAATATLGADLASAARAKTAEAGQTIFDRYPEAGIRVETSLPERFLRAAAQGLRTITSAIDPLGLVRTVGGVPSVDTAHKALKSIRDHLDIHGSSDGKRLQSVFGDPPYGWQADTVRYLVAALLSAGEIRLKLSGQTVAQPGDKAIECLRSNQAFKNVGVSLRGDARPSAEALALAAERLTALLGTDVLPLEDEIARAFSKGGPTFLSRLTKLSADLRSLSLPGAESVESLAATLSDILSNDSVDAAKTFGAQQSETNETCAWAVLAERALADGLAADVASVRRHRMEIESFSGTGALGALKADANDDFAAFDAAVAGKDFPQRVADVKTALSGLSVKTAATAKAFLDEQRAAVAAAKDEIPSLREWPELSREEQAGVLSKLDAIVFSDASDLEGLKRLRNEAFAAQSEISRLRAGVVSTGRAHAEDRRQAAAAAAAKAGAKKAEKTFSLPRTISDLSALDSVSADLAALRDELVPYESIEVTLQLKD